jgi:hypothetical protein
MEQTKLIERTVQDEQGFEGPENKRMYCHVITVGGIEHKYFSLRRDLTEFQSGQEATFTTEEKKDKKNNTYWKIAPVKKQQPFSKGGYGGGKSNYSKDKNSAVITYLSILSSVFNGMQQSSEVFNKEKVAETVEYFYELAKSKAKENDQFGGS